MRFYRMPPFPPLQPDRIIDVTQRKRANTRIHLGVFFIFTPNLFIRDRIVTQDNRVADTRVSRGISPIFVHHNLVLRDDFRMGFARRPVYMRHMDDLGVIVTVYVPQSIRDHMLVKTVELGDPFKANVFHFEDIQNRVSRARPPGNRN